MEVSGRGLIELRTALDSNGELSKAGRASLGLPMSTSRVRGRPNALGPGGPRAVAPHTLESWPWRFLGLDTDRITVLLWSYTMKIPMRLRVDAHSPIPIRWQLTEQLKHVIEGGGVPRDHALPSIRELAGFLGINPNTVARAISRPGHDRGDPRRGPRSGGPDRRPAQDLARNRLGHVTWTPPGAHRAGAPKPIMDGGADQWNSTERR